VKTALETAATLAVVLLAFFLGWAVVGSGLACGWRFAERWLI
jgi:hypothetical protein